MLIQKADLEEETVDEVIRILQQEFADDELEQAAEETTATAPDPAPANEPVTVSEDSPEETTDSPEATTTAPDDAPQEG